MTDLSPSGTIPDPPWTGIAAARSVIEAITADNVPARFVGGCVRDGLLNLPVTDFDIATAEPPDRVIKLLEAASLRAIPTGLKHGTVTAVSDGQPFEVTTLRIDVETDGRRAEVAFTTDWRADAARRDFTMNALYCDYDGTLYDPENGIEDARAGRVRFIGNPRDRLAEDMLRLLRFFRFHAWYGKGDPDEAALSACRETASKIAELSGERLWQEMSKLLIAPDPVPSLTMMGQLGIVGHLLPAKVSEHVKPAALIAMREIEDKANVDPDSIRHLAVWLPNDLDNEYGRADAEIMTQISRRFVHSNAEKARLENLLRPSCRPEVRVSLAENRRRLYWLRSDDSFTDLALFGWAMANDGDDARWQEIVDLPRTNPPPSFPIGGDDVLALGVKPGERVGDLLADIESWWVARDFNPGREALLARLKTLVDGA